MTTPKLNSSVSVVKLSDSVLEFFKTNTRSQIRIKVPDDSVLEIVQSLDGTKSISEIAAIHDTDQVSLTGLLDFMRAHGLLDNVTPSSDFSDYERFRRVIHFLADYSHSHEHLMRMWQRIRNSTVLIVGLGAVGSWLSSNLVQSGVGNLILMDPDKVDWSNLHRQYSFTEQDIGRLKTDVLAERLSAYNPAVRVKCVPELLSGMDDLTVAAGDSEPDLVVNCSDQPNVDTTSMWVGEYCMEHSIPHIIGGGYNMHLSLIGQTVLPGETACLKCFEKTLREENRIDPAKVKKLEVKNRKLGSFAPMCSIVASMTGMEAVKVLSGACKPANINRRGEFDIYSMNVSYKDYDRRDDCEWCGRNGKYSRK